MASTDGFPQGGGEENSPRPMMRPHPKAVLDKYYINPSLIAKPDPFTLYYCFLGKSGWNLKYQKSLAIKCHFAENVLKRRLTQDEVDAFTTHNTRYVYQTQTYHPYFTLAGSYILYRRARRSPYWDVCFPEKSKSPVHDPKVLLQGAKNFIQFGSGYGKAAWAFFFMGWVYISGEIFGAAMAEGTQAKAMESDPRLKEYVARAKAKQSELLNKMIHPPSGGEKSQGGAEESSSGFESEGHTFERSAEDDYTNTNNSNISTAGSSTSSSSPFSSSSDWTWPKSTSSNTSESSQSTGRDFFDDDASPIAPDYRSEESQPQGSAWDRIRNQSLNPGARREQPGPFGSSSASSSSNPVSEGLTEHQQKQAEFDKLVDAERNMSSDRADGSDKKNGGWWGKWN
ncbi:hypothetical protein BO71DRAFT_480728 [Aspergillus ellipticus CBS 707.79]|uniref:Endo-1,3(4)-beta-glucanase n=1 Tax=Aspergillus ellipticus CBS 707.79 TaxID=1448320 RepID=A0A319DK99_9EURO|nr:hypothetical protein BO71DRAFT_480728 [Aspergillus ellipticus CBS 707.79]